jgi:hypothetical protein
MHAVLGVALGSRFVGLDNFATVLYDGRFRMSRATFTNAAQVEANKGS